MTNDRLSTERFPRASRYHPEWLISACSGAANSLWLAEWLTADMPLRPGMRVLDLGCGRAASSIFLHREFGVQVWAADLWFNVTENWQRIQDAGVQDAVFPLHVDARALPFAAQFFDAIVCLDAGMYFATDDFYLGYLAYFLKSGGLLGMANAGLIHEIEGAVPAHLRDWWTPNEWCLHSAAWWRRHWERTGIVDIEQADTLADGWTYWRDWLQAVAPENHTERQAIETDAGRTLGYMRVIAHRRADVTLEPQIQSIPMSYTKQPLLRGLDSQPSK